jgi:hypothetical protein
MDLVNPEQAPPKFGDIIQCIGRTGKLNTRYLVLEARQVKRREPKSFRRINMKVAVIGKDQEAIGSNKSPQTFELRWYERTKRKTRRLGDILDQFRSRYL